MIRHRATTAVIGEAQWNQDHVTPVHALGNLGAAVTIDLPLGAVQTGEVDANVTITLPAVPGGEAKHLTLILTNAGGPWAITVPSVEWIGGTAPDFDDAAGARNALVFCGVAGEGWIGDGGPA